MRVSADDYLKYCHNMKSVITKTEKKIIDAATNYGGWLSVPQYENMMQEAGLCITNRQREILKWLPSTDDDEETMMGKQSMLIRLVKEYREQNEGKH